MIKMKRSILLLLVLLMSFTLCTTLFSGCKKEKEEAKPVIDVTQMRDMTVMELVKDMGLGINLGNTFEAGGMGPRTVEGFETCWGSPLITEEIIKGYKDGGFGVVRVPANWSNLMKKDYTINAEFVARLKQVVTWIIENDMYAIINIHHEGWIKNMPNDCEGVLERYTRFWEQISEEFAEFGDHLMFESMNEDAGFDNVWNSYAGDEGKEEAYEMVNTLNQTFVDIVRGSGGNNPQRHLLIAGYYTGVDTTCDPLFEMPDDPMNRCAVSVHYYNPSTLAILEEDASWGKARTDWGTQEDYESLNYYMDMLKTTFVDNGIPVIVGEYACCGKNKTIEVRRAWTVDVCRAIYEHGMCPVLWDTQGFYYDRETLTYTDPVMMEEFKKIYEENK